MLTQLQIASIRKIQNIDLEVSLWTSDDLFVQYTAYKQFFTVTHTDTVTMLVT